MADESSVMTQRFDSFLLLPTFLTCFLTPHIWDPDLAFILFVS